MTISCNSVDLRFDIAGYPCTGDGWTSAQCQLLVGTVAVKYFASKIKTFFDRIYIEPPPIPSLEYPEYLYLAALQLL